MVDKKKEWEKDQVKIIKFYRHRVERFGHLACDYERNPSGYCYGTIYHLPCGLPLITFRMESSCLSISGKLKDRSMYEAIEEIDGLRDWSVGKLGKNPKTYLIGAKKTLETILIKHGVMRKEDGDDENNQEQTG